MAKTDEITLKQAIHTLQLSLLEGIHNESQLTAASTLLSKSDYQDVVTERTLSHLCGYPLCNNPLPSDRPRKGRYRISLKEHKVYDLRETYLYCGKDCVVSSRVYAESLEDERPLVRDGGRIGEVLKEFGELGFQKGRDLGLGFGELKIEEKLDVELEKLSLDDWIGPSNAIEGYVPVIDRTTKPPKQKQKPAPSKRPQNVSKTKSTSAKTDKGKLVKQPMEFTSSIIIGDQFGFPESSSDPKLKEYIKKLEGLEEEKFIDVEVPSVSGDFDSELRSLVGESQFGIPVMSYDVAAVEGVSNRDGKEVKKDVVSEKVVEKNEAGLKSSIKSTGERKLSRSVTWADQKSSGKGKIAEVREMSETSGSADFLDEESDDGSMFLRSAQACARALNQAAEAVVAGEADVADAVSEAGIIILPQSHDDDEDDDEDDSDDENSQIDEDTMDDDTLEEDLVPLKWPKKPGVFNSEVFNAEDSWYEPPPEGFSLNLSPFATMYMALFGWITSSSLAYIYGQEGQSHEEFVFVNGREYPGKIVLNDGRSSEIKVALAACLSRALPKVAADLRLKTPTFVIEKEMGQLLTTMSFLDSIPAFKLKQWHVIVLLFVDALSVCRIPGIAPHMTSGRILLQKVLDGGEVSGEEYEIMKDLLIPLGRVPQFSAQSGA